MPLIYRKSKQAFGENVAKLIQEGRSERQAVAIASKIRRGYKPLRLKKKRK